MGKMGQKLLENLVINFFWIWSIKKIYINCCILAQIPYLGMSQNAFNQSDCRIFKLTVSLEQNDFLHVDTDSWKSKFDEKILGWVWSKMSLATLVSGL